MPKVKEIILSRRIEVDEDVMKKLQRVFAPEGKMELARPTVSNFLNEKFDNPKAKEIRDLALKLGGHWIKTTMEL